MAGFSPGPLRLEFAGVEGAEIVVSNLLSPVVLAFGLGVAAVLLKSDLEFPEALYHALTIYLLFAIGLKGGMALRATPLASFAAVSSSASNRSVHRPPKRLK